MRIRRGTARFEKVILDSEESFAVKHFRTQRFTYGWHSHPELELTLIVKGRGMRCIGDSIEPFEAGDLCLLGSGLPHTWQSDASDGSVESIVIQFVPDIFSQTIARLPEMKRIAALFIQASRGLQIRPGESHDELVRLMHRLIATKRGSMGRVVTLLQALTAFSDCDALREISLTSFEQSRDYRARGVMGKILDRVHDDREEDKSQAHMARLAGMSPQAFSRFFKAQIGRSYVSYLNEWRISRACRLLAESDEDITAIAFAAGFNNLSNFNRRFLQKKSMAPRDYRAQVAASLTRETAHVQ